MKGHSEDERLSSVLMDLLLIEAAHAAARLCITSSGRGTTHKSLCFFSFCSWNRTWCSCLCFWYLVKMFSGWCFDMHWVFVLNSKSNSSSYASLSFCLSTDKTGSETAGSSSPEPKEQLCHILGPQFVNDSTCSSCINLTTFRVKVRKVSAVISSGPFHLRLSDTMLSDVFPSAVSRSGFR